MLVQRLKAKFLKRYLLRYPPELRQGRYEVLQGLKWLKKTLEDIKPEVLPEGRELVEKATSSKHLQPFLPVIQAQPSYYQQYRCASQSPLQCGHLLESLHAEPSATQCSHCKFPVPLSVGQQIFGKRGTYEILASLGQRGVGRVYRAMETGSGQTVTLKEFLLPSLYFAPETQKTQQRQEAFTNLAGFSLADGRSQDLRISIPVEAIAPPGSPQAFLIAPQTDSHLTLNQALALRGPLNCTETKRLLNQVLQSLSFLHQQKFTLPLGQLKAGIVHGNLNLNSLLWVESIEAEPLGKPEIIDQSLAQGKNFFIHLTDFLLWEQLFHPAVVDLSVPTVEDDLNDLGYLAFYALNGAVTTAKNASALNGPHRSRPAKALNPRLDAHWPENIQTSLKQYLRQLMGLEGSFETATAARLALLKLPTEQVISNFAPPDQESNAKLSWWSIYGPYILALGGLAAGGSLLWLLLKPKAPSLAETPPPPCCLSEVGGIGLETYRYSSVRDSSWQRLLQVAESPEAPQPNLLSQLALHQPELNLSYQSSPSIAATIADLQAGKIDFAILPEITQLPEGLTAQTIAYDGLVAFVAFNYLGRDRGLPPALKGRIELDTLQQLYQDRVENWKSLSRSKLPAQVYWPKDPVAIQQFQQVVLGLEPQMSATELSGQNDSATGVSDDSAVLASSAPFLDSSISPSWDADSASLIEHALPVGEMLRETIRDFESRGVGSLGFAPLSAVYGQCSVYPLAISTPEGPVQPLMMDGGKPINPGVDLCDRKGSYGPDGDRFRDGSYPLAYGVAVVYPMDNSRPDIGQRFAELLLTQEGQSLLEEAGFITTYPVAQ